MNLFTSKTIHFPIKYGVLLLITVKIFIKHVNICVFLVTYLLCLFSFMLGLYCYDRNINPETC